MIFYLILLAAIYPYPDIVETAKVTFATRYTVVVVLRLIRHVDTGNASDTVAATEAALETYPAVSDGVGIVADVLLMPNVASDVVVPVSGFVIPSARTSQSPAVREILVMFVSVADVSETAEADAILLETYSPTNVAVALSFVFVPIMEHPVGVKLAVRVLEFLYTKYPFANVATNWLEAVSLFPLPFESQKTNEPALFAVAVFPIATEKFPDVVVLTPIETFPLLLHVALVPIATQFAFPQNVLFPMQIEEPAFDHEAAPMAMADEPPDFAFLPRQIESALACAVLLFPMQIA